MGPRNQPPIPSGASRAASPPGKWFESLEWLHDRMLCHGWVYELVEHSDHPRNVPGRDCFRFYKSKGLIDQYDAFLSRRPEFVPQRIMELGIWDGGSVALWFQVFQPRTHVAIDLAGRGDSEYFRAFVEAHAAAKRLRTLWGMDQADESRLAAIVRDEFDGPLDLVIDDASHVYRPTLASFEVLWPHVRPGGLYVIEDWAWEHWPAFHQPDHFWAAEESPTRLVHEFVESAGGPASPIAEITVMNGFVALERSAVALPADRPFRIREWLTRRPAYGRRRRVAERPDPRAPGKAELRVFVISWQGQHERAASIANAIHRDGGDVRIVYSDPDIRRLLHVECPVIRRSDHLFWSDKFRACLEGAGGGDILLIQADCDCDDWPGLARRCREVFAAVPQCAVWAPHIDGTPYPSDVATISRVTADGLWAAAQTDGIVVGMARSVLDRLQQARLEENIYGWGIDQMAVAAAYSEGGAALIDLSQRVVHPQTRGYPTDVAQAQWESFLEQLSPEERDWHDELWRFLRAGVAIKARQSGSDLWLGGRVVAAEGTESTGALEEHLAAIRIGLETRCAGRLAAARAAAAAADIASAFMK